MKAKKFDNLLKILLKTKPLRNMKKTQTTPLPTTVRELPEGFTNGEWSVSTTSLKNDCIIGKDKGIVCVIAMWRKEREANAKLIASAPLLLEALKEASDILVHSVNNEKGNKIKTAILKECPDVRSAMNKIRAAIQSATL